MSAEGPGSFCGHGNFHDQCRHCYDDTLDERAMAAARLIARVTILAALIRDTNDRDRSERDAIERAVRLADTLEGE